MVEKGPVDWGGLASMSGGDFDAVLPGENVDDFVRDLIYYYDGLCEQDLIEEIFKHSYERLKDYQRFSGVGLRLVRMGSSGASRRGLLTTLSSIPPS